MKDIFKNGFWFIKESIKYNNPRKFKEWVYVLTRIPSKTLWFCKEMKKTNSKV